MKIEVFENPDAVAQAAAKFIAAEACRAVAARGSFIFAVSGGQTPWVMLRTLAAMELPWKQVQVVQVDERVAPAGDPDRNFTHLRASLLDHAPLETTQVHAMPVEDVDLAAAATRYAATLRELAGAPPTLDLVHLGLGADGHTASLVPNDPVLDVEDADVAVTGGVYMGLRRMTLTFPTINRARRILWVVTGGGKAPMLRRLRAVDTSIPAGRIRQDNAMVLADYPAATRVR